MNATTVSPVTVIIPVYNCERYIAEAIGSVHAQSKIKTQVLVIDDGSTDESARIADECGAKVIRQSNSGIGAARNTGVEHAQYDFLAFLDADDLWHPDKLKMQLEIWLRQQSPGIVFARVKQFLSPELDEQTKAGLRCPEDTYAGICAGTLLTSRAVMDKIGGFSSDRRLGEFVEWYARVKDANVPVFIAEQVLLYRRIYDSNTGIRKANSRKDYLYRLKEVIDRRKSEGP